MSIKRILEVAKKYHLSHVGSALTAWPILEEIFRLKKKTDRFVLSNGHAALALAVMLGEEKEMEKNIHADRSWCDCSTGSLGHGLGIAVGMALADRSKEVWCMISDGECAEGSIWEALRVAWEQKLWNLQIYVNANGWASYHSVDRKLLEKRLQAFWPNIHFWYMRQQKPFLGLEGHYKKL